MIVAEFAKEWGISTKQVQRDLKLFAELGHRASPHVTGTPSSHPNMTDPPLAARP